MEIRKIEINKNFKRIPKKLNGVRVILTHEFSKKIEKNQFDFILKFYKYTKFDINKYSFEIVKNDGFYGQIGQNITKNSLCLEFNDTPNKNIFLSYFLYLTKIYNETFIIYFYEDKKTFLIRNSDIDYFEEDFFEVINAVEQKCLTDSFFEINNLLTHDCLLIISDKDTGMFTYDRKESYSIINDKYKISLLPNDNILHYLINYHKDFNYKLNFILVKKGNKLHKYNSSLLYIKTYKSLNILKFINRALFKNVYQIEKAEYTGISYKYAPHDVYKKVIMYHKL